MEPIHTNRHIPDISMNKYGEQKEKKLQNKIARKRIIHQKKSANRKKEFLWKKKLIQCFCIHTCVYIISYMHVDEVEVKNIKYKRIECC